MNHPTWEYLTMPTGALSDEQMEERLNELGADGWELIALRSTSSAILKRPGPDFRERITIAQRDKVDARVNGFGDEA